MRIKRVLLGLLIVAVVAGFGGIAMATQRHMAAASTATEPATTSATLGDTENEQDENLGQAKDEDAIKNQDENENDSREQDAIENQDENESDSQDENGDMAVAGSIAVPSPEPTDLSALAKITPDQAKTAALAVNPGATVVSVELENEDGYLVYDVEFQNGTDVKVDAGTAVVLRSDAPDQSEAPGSEQGETMEDSAVD